MPEFEGPATIISVRGEILVTVRLLGSERLRGPH